MSPAVHPPPIRILVMTHVTARSGAEMGLVRFLRLIDQRKFAVVVALPSGEGMVPETLAGIPGITVRVVPADPVLLRMRKTSAWRTLAGHPGIIFSLISLVRRYRRLVRDENIQLILASSIKSDYYGALIACLSRIPIVFHIHDYVDAHYFPWWSRRSLVIFANLFASSVVCNSNAVRDALAREGVRAKKLVTVYAPAFQIEEQGGPAGSVREELKLGPATRLVALIGRITPPKGQWEFIQAALLLLARRADTVFLVVGDSVFGSYDDDYKRRIEDVIRRSAHADRIRMLGMRDDVLRITAAADVIVFPSLWPEGFGLALAEAMQLGRPVVATALGGTGELIEDRVTGLRVEPGDVAGLSRAVATLLDEPGLAQAVGEAARRHIQRLMSADNVRALEAVLRQAAARDRHPAPSATGLP